MPGNHDVDRKIANSKVTKTLHESIRAKQGPAAVDKELREILTDENSAKALLAPLAEYNTFAARFQCSLSAAKPYWERDLSLPCGTIIRLRGLCSALVSNQHDEKNNIVLGQAQVNVHRVDGVEYLTLCHHPPDWLQDQDMVVSHLESKVRLQLFGHKHAQRVQEINGTLRVTAGAMHPERDERDWEPMYNVIEIARLDEQRLCVRLFQRRWHKVNHHFLAEQDSNTNQPHHSYVWQDCPRPAHKKPLTVETPTATAAVSAMSTVVAAKPTAKDNEAMPLPNHERRLTYRFLTLSFCHQIAVVNSLSVLTDEDREMSNEMMFHELFKRAKAKGLLGKLWAETEKRHTDPVLDNPFNITK